jgi:hypothetical protein
MANRSLFFVIGVAGLASSLWFSLRGGGQDLATSPAMLALPPLPSASAVGQTEHEVGAATGGASSASSPQRDFFAPKSPYALSPSARSLGDAANDVLTRADAKRALALVRTMEECLRLEVKQQIIDLERAHPSSVPGVTTARVKEQSEQLARSRAECQTLAEQPQELMLKLAQLAYSAGEPGAALHLLQLRTEKTPLSTLLDAVAKDARSGELRSLPAAIASPEVPVSEAERIEMAFALQGVWKKAPTACCELPRLIGGVAEYYWNGTVSRTPGAAPEPRTAVFKRDGGLSTLPPDLTLPTDPAAQARISKLTEQLIQQVKQLEKEQEAARRRAAGGS